MKLFEAEESFTVALGPGGLRSVRRAIQAFFEFHSAEFTEETRGEFRFKIPAFTLSSRNKPLHRFQHGTICVSEKTEGQVEVRFQARLSKPNVASCIGAVLLGFIFAAAMLSTGETPIWWALAAVAAGPVIAYTARDQCVSRLKKALFEAASLAQRST